MSLTTIELSAENLLHNVRALRSLTHSSQSVTAVVKGNAYGHGLAEVVSTIQPEVEAFQVDDIEELRQIRPLTEKPVLVLGYVPRKELEEAISLEAQLGAFDREHIAWIGTAARRMGVKVAIHLKIDALLGRLGTLPGEVLGLVEELSQWPELRVECAYAHFGNIEDTTDLGHATSQTEAFDLAFSDLKEAIPGLRRHMSATSGLLTIEQLTHSQNSSVRLGIGLYGMYPSAALSRSHRDLRLKPVLRWVTHLSQVKELPSRHPVGYGLAYVTSQSMRIGIVPQGYSGRVRPRAFQFGRGVGARKALPGYWTGGDEHVCHRLDWD